MISVLPFSMRELAGFRILRANPGTAALLTDGPSDNADPVEQPILLITIAPMNNRPQPEERDRIARQLMAETPGLKEIRIVNSESLRIANQPGHEVVVEAKSVRGDVDLKAVQWLRFGSGTLLRMVGVVRKDQWSAVYRRMGDIREGIGPR
jgi:hypothetical protein